MPGKTRPSLRQKTLLNVALSNLSVTDKKCIVEVFRMFEELMSEQKVKCGAKMDKQTELTKLEHSSLCETETFKVGD